MNLTKTSKSLALAVPLAAAAVSEADAAGYLKIGDIKGESQIANYENFIKIGTFAFKIEIEGATDGTRGGTLKHRNPVITFPVERASPQLMLACATGQVIPQATLILTKNEGENEVAFYKITMTDIVVSSYSTGGSADGQVPTEEITLGYTEVEWTYYRSDGDGKIVEQTTTGVLQRPVDK